MNKSLINKLKIIENAYTNKHNLIKISCIYVDGCDQ